MKDKISDNKIELEKELVALEEAMLTADFWQDKFKAQETIKRIAEIKAEIAGEGKYDSGDSIMTIFSGAGGDDAEDFSGMLFNMYLKYCQKKK